MIIPSFVIISYAVNIFTGKLGIRCVETVYILIRVSVLGYIIWRFYAVSNGGNNFSYFYSPVTVCVFFFSYYISRIKSSTNLCWVLKLSMTAICILYYTSEIHNILTWFPLLHAGTYILPDNLPSPNDLEEVNPNPNVNSPPSGSVTKPNANNPTFTHPINKTIRWSGETTPNAIGSTVGHIIKAVVENAGPVIVTTGGVSAGAKVMASSGASPAVKVGGTLVVGAGALVISEVAKNVTKTEQGEGSQILKVLEGILKKESGSGSGSGMSTPGTGQFNYFAPTSGGISSWWDIVMSFVPKDLAQDVIMRIPSGASEGVYGHYNLLFMKYNLLIYLMLGCLILVAISYFFQYVLSLMQRNRNFLAEHTPKILGLGSFASSKWPNILIVILRLSIFLNYWTMFQSIYFMYENYIPNDVGPIYDTVLANQTGIAAEITDGQVVSQLPQQELDPTVKEVETEIEQQ